MDETILAVYKYMLGAKCYAVEARKAISFIEKYSAKKGTFWCWHDWRQFEVHSLGWNIFISGTQARCAKCGKIGFTHNAKVDQRLFDWTRHVSYM